MVLNSNAVIVPSTTGTRTTRAIMLNVMVGLLPGTALYAVLISEAIILQVILAIVTAWFFEAFMLRLRNKSITQGLQDGSITLAAWLLALCLPPSLPLWQLVCGTFVMCTLGKHVFGGTGHNPFNPAMVAYAVLLVSFPVNMSQWPAVSNASATDEAPALDALDAMDAVSGATPLDRARLLKREYKDRIIEASDSQTAPDNTSDLPDSTTTEQEDTLAGLVLESSWLWVNIGWLLGGVYLLLRRIITWHIPVSVLATLSVLYALPGLSNAQALMPVIPALLSGAIIFGCFFIATDPVSAASSRTGQLVYGAGIAILCFVIREYSIYPEGFAFAVLLMNSCVPLIDHIFSRA